MAKTLSFTFDGKDYTLEYTRNSVRQMERQGFIAEEIDKKPMTVLPALFAGAFIAHHRFVKQDVIEAIYAKLSNKQQLLEKLVEMYNEPIASLLDEPDEGNVTWTANW